MTLFKEDFMRLHAIIGGDRGRVAEAERVLGFEIGHEADRTDAGLMLENDGEDGMRARGAREVVQTHRAAFAERMDRLIAVRGIAERTMREELRSRNVHVESVTSLGERVNA
jgi:hypothetical protein